MLGAYASNFGIDVHIYVQVRPARHTGSELPKPGVDFVDDLAHGRVHQAGRYIDAGEDIINDLGSAADR